MIKEYFANYFLHSSDVTFDVQNNEMQVHQGFAEPWKVTVVDTGESTMTGGRLRRVASFLAPTEDFCLTYGDGLSDVNIRELIRFHQSNGTEATLTAVVPAARFGVLNLDADAMVRSFAEKPRDEGGRVNGGFFVLNPSVLSLITGDDTIWERAPLEELARRRQLGAFEHHGFWQPMDTLRDKELLERLWQAGTAPWKTW
jgi:glucose-1-phosphate cytidylyltransferase